jgi:hypothetical protein
MDVAAFQGFAQGLQDPAVELGQFVEEQHAVVGQGNLPGPGLGPAVSLDNYCDNGIIDSSQNRLFCRNICDENGANRRNSIPF